MRETFYEKLLADAFGNAIGNTIAGQMQQAKSKEKAEAQANKAREALNRAMENGATAQQATQQAVNQLAGEQGLGGIGQFTADGRALSDGMDLTLTNAEGVDGHFNLSSVNTVESGYNMIGYVSEFLRGTPNMGVALNGVTNQVIERTQRYHDSRMSSLPSLDMAKYKLGGANGVFDRPAMVGIPGVTPGPWAPEFIQAPSGTNSPAWMRQATGQYGPWSDGYIAPITPQERSAWDITKDAVGRSFEFYHDAIVNWPSNVGNAILNALPDEGGFTYTQGLQATGEFVTKGITGTPYGEFFNVDFASQTLNVGNYWSIQGGPDIGIRPLASADASLELSLYFDGGDYLKSLTGPFFAEGAEGALGLGFGFETVQALQPKGQRFVEGVSLSLAVGSADLSGHAQFGYGNIWAPPQEIPFADVPSYFFHRWTNGVFK